jgi:hypothetical protein
LPGSSDVIGQHGGAFVICLALLCATPAVAAGEPDCAAAASALPAYRIAITAAEQAHATKPLELEFTAVARCLRAADDTQLPAVLFSIDPAAGQVNLRLTSISGKAATLPARLRLLDERYEELKAISFDRFVKRGLNYSTTLFLDAYAQPRYLLVTPDVEWLGRSNQLTSGHRWTSFWTTGQVMGSISNGVESRDEVPFAAGGSLRVEVEQESRVVAPVKAH